MYDKKERHKMYKSGKHWVIGTVTTVSCVLGGLTVGTHTVHADNVAPNSIGRPAQLSSGTNQVVTLRKNSSQVQRQISQRSAVTTMTAPATSTKSGNANSSTTVHKTATTVAPSTKQSSSVVKIAPGKAVQANEDDQAVQINKNGHWYLQNQEGKKLTGFQYIKSDSKTVYYDPQTGVMVYGQQCISGHWYLFDNYDGALQFGYQWLAGLNKEVYYDPRTGAMVYGPQVINGHHQYFNPQDGAQLKNGYATFNGQTSYYDGNGNMVYGQQYLNGHWQYFDPRTGAQARNKYVTLSNLDKTVYYDGNGDMVYGQQYLNGHWQYFDPTTGAQAKGKFIKLTDLNKTVYYNADGDMVYGAQMINGKRYYFDPQDGAMWQDVLQKQGKHLVYYGDNGAQVINQKAKIGNTEETFDANGYIEGSGQVGLRKQWYLLKDGIIQTGYQWLARLNKEVYYDPQTGKMVYGQQHLNGHWQYFDPVTGAQARNQYVKITNQNNKIVYYDGNGNMVYGQQHLNGHWQYFDPTTGAQAKNQFIRLENLNKTVYYDCNGNMVYGWQQISWHMYYFNTFDGSMYTGNQNIDGTASKAMAF